jgi:F-type H+-transporting ATPase subunit a
MNEIEVYKVINIFGQDVWITQTTVTTWALMLIIIFVAFLARLQLKKFTEKPTGAQNVIELCIEQMDNFVTGTMGEKYSYFANWFFGVFVFILVSNLSGLLGFRPPTADYATTASLAFSTFILIHFMGIKTNKGGYFKSYVEPIPVMLPMNIISELATPISLSFRLFGNILGGSIIMGMVYELPRILNIGIPGVLHIYFDVFAGCIQTVIFVMLSMTFIKDKIGE